MIRFMCAFTVSLFVLSMCCDEWLICFAEKREKVLCTQDAKPFLAVPLVSYDRHLCIASVTLCLFHPKIGIACLDSLNLPM